MSLSTTRKLDFFYNSFGRGDLRFWVDGETALSYPSRTGSVSAVSGLVNACPIGTRYLCDGPADPVPDEADTMFVVEKPGKPWKIRLWPYPVPPGHAKVDGILIHPDGSKGHQKDGNGTMGCIGTLDNAEELRIFLLGHFANPDADCIAVEINRI